MNWIEHNDCSTKDYVCRHDPEGSLGADCITPEVQFRCNVGKSVVHFNQGYIRHRTEKRNAQCSENTMVRYLLGTSEDARHWV